MKPFSIWSKLLLLTALLLIVVKCTSPTMHVEGMGGRIENTEKTGQDVYDSFYADIYDYLTYSDVKNAFEIGVIVNQTTPTFKSTILDIGSGIGHHVKMLSDKGFQVLGLDKSLHMIEKAALTYPVLKDRFVQGDALNTHTFRPYSFTHILCFNTLYQVKDKRRLLENMYDWLKPGGTLVLHMVNRDKYNPVLPLSVKSDSYQIPFQSFDYSAFFQLNKTNNVATLHERFKKRDGKSVRRHRQHFYMESQEEILSMAQEIGFIIQAKIDLALTGYANEYLFVLVKPN